MQQRNVSRQIPLMILLGAAAGASLAQVASLQG